MSGGVGCLGELDIGGSWIPGELDAGGWCVCAKMCFWMLVTFVNDINLVFD